VIKRGADVLNKNSWFILRAIESERSSASPNQPPRQTLADMLARDPLSPNGGYSAPVWLTLGPSNKGFKMLQQSGWNEGEGLGRQLQRRTRMDEDFIDAEEPVKRKNTRSESQQIVVKKVKWGEGVEEIQDVDFIDLTICDYEGDQKSGDRDALEYPFCHLSVPATSLRSTPLTRPSSPHSPRILLTPIAVVLKSDRLGIGLKAKTTGPYKASKKRVTHGAAALAAHIRAAEDARRKKLTMGRGHRRFTKMAKLEQERRQKMLAYLNE